MKKTALLLLCAGLLTACGEDQTSTQRDATGLHGPRSCGDDRSRSDA